MEKPKNVIVWFDIPTSDFDRARRFYSKILGDEVRIDETMGMKLGVFPMDETQGQGMGVGGDLVPPGQELKPSPTGQRVFFSVEGRLDEALARVEPAGGMIIQSKFKLEGAGWLAVIRDTEGNQVGLHSSK